MYNIDLCIIGRLFFWFFMLCAFTSIFKLADTLGNKKERLFHILCESVFASEMKMK